MGLPKILFSQSNYISERMSKGGSRRSRTLFSSFPSSSSSSSSLRSSSNPSSSSSDPWTKVCTYESFSSSSSTSSSSSLLESSSPSPSPSSQWRRIGRRPSYCLKPSSTLVVVAGYHTSKTPPRTKHSHPVVADNFDPNLVRYNKQIQARAKSGPMPPGLATELLNEVKRSGLLPNVFIYTTLISSCSRWSNFEEGVEIYNHMLLASNCRLNLYTYNAMISLYGRCGMPREAEKVFKELKSKGFMPNVVTYNSLINAFAKDENIEKVEEICREIDALGIAKDEITCGILASLYGRCGRAREAEKV